MSTVQLSQRPFLVLITAVILHVVLISAQVNTTTGASFLQVATFGAFAEVQRAAMTTFGSVKGLWTGYVDLRSVQGENETLKRELETAHIRLQEERAFAQRTEGFRQLLDLRQRAGVETVASEIIGAGAQNDVRALTLDKGASDGIKKDMAVISPAGVVGRVILSSGRAAQVQLLVDRNAAVAALIERTRAQGVVFGQHTDTLALEYVPGTADVRAGDLVVTSGMDGIYPKGFVIGRVDVVERGAGTFHKITVRPGTDFSRLEEVLVVTTPPSIKAAQQAEAVVAKQRPPSATEPVSTNQSPPRPRATGNRSPSAIRPVNQTPRSVQPRTVAPAVPPAPGDQSPPSGIAPPPGNQTPPGGTAPPPGNQTPPGSTAPPPGNQTPPGGTAPRALPLSGLSEPRADASGSATTLDAILRTGERA